MYTFNLQAPPVFILCIQHYFVKGGTIADKTDIERMLLVVLERQNSAQPVYALP